MPPVPPTACALAGEIPLIAPPLGTEIAAKSAATAMEDNQVERTEPQQTNSGATQIAAGNLLNELALPIVIKSPTPKLALPSLTMFGRNLGTYSG